MSVCVCVCPGVCVCGGGSFALGQARIEACSSELTDRRADSGYHLGKLDPGAWSRLVAWLAERKMRFAVRAAGRVRGALRPA